MLTLGRKLPGEEDSTQQKKNAPLPIYRPGKAPQYASSSSSSSSSHQEEHADEDNYRTDTKSSSSSRVIATPTIIQSSANRVVHQAEIIRAARPIKKQEHEDEDDNEEDQVDQQQYRKQLPQKHIDLDTLAVPEPEAITVEEDEDNDRRARVKARAKQRAEEEARAAAAAAAAAASKARSNEEEDGESSEYEYVTDSDEEEEETVRPLFKPVFVSKQERETLADREKLEQEQEALEEMEKSRLKERKEQSRQIIIDEIRKEDEEAAKEEESDTEMPDDTDDLEDEAAIEAWKQRELARIKRDKDFAEKEEQEKADVERRRQMSDAEIMRENARLGLLKTKDKSSMRFMQKYFHRGAFYQDGDVVDKQLLERDFSAPTGMDADVDKSILPKVMQVKAFGMAGRTKYTHLVDQDTSQLQSNAWNEASKLGVPKNPFKNKGFQK